MDELTNAWIAEHVMGWRPVSGYYAIAEETGGVEHMTPVNICHLKRVWFADHGEQMACDECGDLPDFLGSLADSLLLLDTLFDQGYSSVLHRSHVGRYPCMCEIWKLGLDGWRGENYIGQGLTRELAIGYATQELVLARKKED